MIETAHGIVPGCKYYQASSSEMFGNSFDEDQHQRETTPMNPVSPYGIAKVFAYNTVRHYRHAYNMHATNGILFNHESPRRGSNFVTAKVVKQAVEIYRGIREQLELGNMDSKRDWGHSKDYCINADVPILTPNGWRFKDEVKAGDEIINFDTMHNCLARDTVQQTHKLSVNDRKIRLRGRGLNLTVTPNHRIIYQHKSKRSKGGWSRWKETTAEELWQTLHDASLRTMYDYRLPGFRAYAQPDLNGWSDARVYLLGAFAAEGSWAQKPGSLCISLSQSLVKNERVHAKIEEYLHAERLTFRTATRNDGVTEWSLNARSSREVVDWFGHVNIHLLPRTIFQFGSRQLELLYTALMDCDGCWGASSFSSKRSLLAADFQTIAHLTGRRTTSVKQRRSGMYHVGVISPARGQYAWIQQIDEVRDGIQDVWCVTTANGTIITRDAGSISISGNCRAMWTMLQHDKPGDWVVSTGVAHSVRDLCHVVFSELGMNYEDYVVQNIKYMRPEELKFLCGDSTKIREELGWAPEYDFYDLIKEVIDYWLTRIPA
jgi:GDP-D-mannose dehydratase